jgi:glutamyl-tRNA reductase
VRRAISGNKKGIYLLGLSHRTSPLPVREKALLVLSALGEELAEAVLLSTCNRVELYFSTESPEEAFRQLPDDLKASLYFKVNAEAFKHLALVAAGCESLALGETQIAGQVKRAYEEARNAGKVDKLLSRFFEQALKASKEIRNRTGIQCLSISIPALAVKFARKELGVLSRRAIGVLGTGEVAQLLLKYLDRNGVYLIGRSWQKLSSLSRKYSAVPVGIHKLGEVLRTLDLLFVATTSPRPLLEKKHLESATREKLLIIDLSVPRSVEEEVRALPNVAVTFVDDLEAEAARNRKMKEERLKGAEAIARVAAEEFRRWYDGLEAEEVVIALLNELDRVPAETLLKRAIERLKADPALAGAFRKALGI